MKKFLKAIPVGIPSAIAVGIVAYFSLSANPLGSTEFTLSGGLDKAAHFLLYFFVTCVFILDYAKFVLPHHSKMNFELLFTCTAMVLGLIMEASQLLIDNGRGYDSMDIVANCLGAVAAFAFLHFVGLHKFRRYFLHSHRHHHHH